MMIREEHVREFKLLQWTVMDIDTELDDKLNVLEHEMDAPTHFLRENTLFGPN